MPSMPCANTSSRPAARAKSLSTWIGLWSPDAPQYSASVRRLIGSACSAGSSVPTCTSSKRRSAIADHREAFHVGDQPAVLVGHPRLAQPELECAALPLVQFRDPRRAAPPAAPLGPPVE